MPRAARGSTKQKCPGCGVSIDTAGALPLELLTCRKCGKELRAQRSFDHFELVETLGLGGMGAVYKARDTQQDRLVALKLLRADLADSALHTAQFQEEARLAASINHPNVVRVFSSGTDHGQFYLVMELVDGGSLDDLIERHKSLPEESVLQTGVQVARGLRAAQARGLIHSDVKPANILFLDETTAKISDFGLAAIAAQTPGARAQIWGTPYYVAPERLNSHPDDLRSDIYSLGASLFHALAGKPPIQAETTSPEKLRKLKYQPLDLADAMPGASEETLRVFQRMLAPDPAQRFSSYDELLSAFETATRARKRARKAEVKRALKDLKNAERARQPWSRRIALATALLLVGTLAGGATALVVRRPDLVAVARDRIASLGQRFAARSASSASTAAPGAIFTTNQSKAVAALPWDSALAQYKERLARYDFLGAAGIIGRARPDDRMLQAELDKKAQWLARWKNKMIVDLNHHQFSGAITDTDRAEYTGIVSANADQIMLKTRYGIVGLPWSKVPSRKLLAISASFIGRDERQTADRQWLCAVFASTTGQFNEARELAEAAARTKPEYQRELALIVSATSAAR